MSDTEYEALGAALRAAEAANVWPAAVAAARFLALTGWRRGERRWLSDGTNWTSRGAPQRFGDTKTGRSIVHSPVRRAPCFGELSGAGDLVFPATRGEGRLSGFPKLWARIAKLGGLPADVTPHVLRHSFASLAGDLGYSEPTIAALIGHKGRTMISRYVHAADAVLLAAADAVADRTRVLMGDACPEAQVVQLRA